MIDRSNKTFVFLFLIFLFVLSLGCDRHSSADPNGWSGEVVHVADGDTITVKRGNEKVKIRLYGVDCPEGGQEQGDNSKDFTSAQVFGKTVHVREMDVDRYGRVVALVSVGDLIINRHLIEYGYA